MKNDGNAMQSADTAPSSTTTMVSRVEAYSLPACCPSLFFTDIYTGKNAVTRMPPITSS